LGLKVKILSSTFYGYKEMVGSVGTIIQIDGDTFLMSTISKIPLTYGTVKSAETGEAWVHKDDSYQILGFEDYAKKLKRHISSGLPKG
jgi:hypothetical protein